MEARHSSSRALREREATEATGYEPFDHLRDNRLRAFRAPISLSPNRWRVRKEHLKRVQRPFPDTWLKPRPESGFGCITCAEFARQRPKILNRFSFISGKGAARAEDAQGTPTQSHISPSILVYEHKTGSTVYQNACWIRITELKPVFCHLTLPAAFKEQLLRSNEKQFRGGLVFKARRRLYHSTVGRE